MRPAAAVPGNINVVLLSDSVPVEDLTASDYQDWILYHIAPGQGYRKNHPNIIPFVPTYIGTAAFGSGFGAFLALSWTGTDGWSVNDDAPAGPGSSDEEGMPIQPFAPGDGGRWLIPAFAANRFLRLQICPQTDLGPLPSGTMHLKLSLSDGSAPDHEEDIAINTPFNFKRYSINYNAAHNGQFIIVEITFGASAIVAGFRPGIQGLMYGLEEPT